MSQNRYVSSVFFRPDDFAADRELEVRRQRAVAGRRASRQATSAYLRAWASFLFGSRGRVAQPSRRRPIAHG